MSKIITSFASRTKFKLKLYSVDTSEKGHIKGFFSQPYQKLLRWQQILLEKLSKEGILTFNATKQRVDIDIAVNKKEDIPEIEKRIDAKLNDIKELNQISYKAKDKININGSVDADIIILFHDYHKDARAQTNILLDYLQDLGIIKINDTRNCQTSFIVKKPKELNEKIDKILKLMASFSAYAKGLIDYVIPRTDLQDNSFSLAYENKRLVAKFKFINNININYNNNDIYNSILLNKLKDLSVIDYEISKIFLSWFSELTISYENINEKIPSLSEDQLKNLKRGLQSTIFDNLGEHKKYLTDLAAGIKDELDLRKDKTDTRLAKLLEGAKESNAIILSLANSTSEGAIYDSVKAITENIEGNALKLSARTYTLLYNVLKQAEAKKSEVRTETGNKVSALWNPMVKMSSGLARLMMPSLSDWVESWMTQPPEIVPLSPELVESVAKELAAIAQLPQKAAVDSDKVVVNNSADHIVTIESDRAEERQQNFSVAITVADKRPVLRLNKSPSSYVERETANKVDGVGAVIRP